MVYGDLVLRYFGPDAIIGPMCGHREGKLSPPRNLNRPVKSSIVKNQNYIL